MFIETLYIPPLLSGVKSIKNIFFPDPSRRKTISDPFYPAWGKMGLFSDGVWIDLFGAYDLFFVLYVEKHGLNCPMKDLNCIQKLFKKCSGPIGSKLQNKIN